MNAAVIFMNMTQTRCLNQYASRFMFSWQTHLIISVCDDLSLRCPIMHKTRAYVICKFVYDQIHAMHFPIYPYAFRTSRIFCVLLLIHVISIWYRRFPFFPFFSFGIMIASKDNIHVQGTCRKDLAPITYPDF